MNSPFATLFLALTDRIRATVPAIRCIDQDLGQLEYYTTTPNVTFPCALIDFSGFTATDFSENVQLLAGQVTIRLAFTPYSSATASAPQLYREKALEYYDIEFALHQSLHSWQAADNFGSLSRHSTGTEKRDDAIRVRTLVYSIAIEDYSTRAAVQTAFAGVKLDL